MLHNLSAGSATSPLSPQPDLRTTLHLARPGDRTARPAAQGSDLVPILSRRCSAFCAEAAVLVLVFGLLDYFMMKGRIEIHWIVGALGISVLLLALSIVIELSAQRWMKAHP